MRKNGFETLLRLLVVEDEELVLAAFCMLVQQLEGVELAGTASSGEQAVEQARAVRPDLILMDLLMPVMDGIEATRAIKSMLPATKVVALTALEDPLQITRALEAGMDGFLLKKATPQELQLAVATVRSGEKYLSPAVSAIIARVYLDERSRKREPLPQLTPREKQVVRLLSDGLRLKRIAEELGISERTAEKHCEQAKRKLKAATTAELVAVWLRMS